MKDIFLDACIDTFRLVPFLFIAFLIIEFTEHKLSKKQAKLIGKSSKFGPLIGSILGVFPQCGFSVLATNLYVTRIISLGTLIAIYLSTSDEMLPILIASKASFSDILSLVLVKLFVGIIFGFIIDFIFSKKGKANYDICDHDHCDCDHGVFVSALKHTIKITLFIFVFTLVLDFILHFGGEEFLRKLFSFNNFFTPFLSGLIGLIPNCGASILITELYLKGLISFAGAISGLLTGSGVSLLVLFKTNKNLKENLKITLLLYGIGVFVGIVIELINLV